MFVSIIITAVNLSTIDLNLLWTLHVVLTERSVARAAAKLHLTAPAVSNALSRLRAILGDPLLVRSGRGLTPTPRALELEPVLTASLGALSHALDNEAAFDPMLSTRELCIALSDTDQLASLPGIARAVAERFPRARLHVVSIDTLLARGGLAHSSIDLAIGPAERAEGIHAAPLYQEEAVFVVRRDHPRVRRKLTRERFLAERHVDIHLALGKGGTGHRAAEEAFARHGLSRDIAVTVPTFAAAAMVVAATELIAGMPRRVAETLARSAPLAIMSPPMPALRFGMSLLWHERTHRDPAATYFRQLVTEALAKSAPRASKKKAG